MTHESPSNREIIVDFARLFYQEGAVREAFERYVHPEYVQHNPGISDGRENAIVSLTPMWRRPGFTTEVLRILVDGDYAALHVRADNGPGKPKAAVFDLYRLHDGLIVEHWDVIHVVPDNSANTHPMF
jgi:predicted SnoaL-like aldol condensation-catalyzing enzyme